MKTKSLFERLSVSVIALMLGGMVFSACGTTFGSLSYDDVYSDTDEEEYLKEEPAKKSRGVVYQDPRYRKQVQSHREQLSSEQSGADGSGIQNPNDTTAQEYAAYDQDDYYDYAYSARLRRFHSPIVYSDYYADYYTDLYWYTYDPFLWGTSIYLGYSWWYPSFYHGWYSPYYSYWYSPWYAYGWYHPYYHHHHHHCWDPCHHICYYNSHDHNSNLYRGMSTGTNYIRRGNGGISNAGYVNGGKIERGLGKVGSTNGKTNAISRSTTTGGGLTRGSSAGSISRGSGTSSGKGTLAKPSRLTRPATDAAVTRTGGINRSSSIGTTRNTARRTDSYVPPTSRRSSSSTSTTVNRRQSRSVSNSATQRSTNRSTINRNNSRSYNNSRSVSSPSRSSSIGRSSGSTSRSSSSFGGSRSGGGGSIRR